MRRFWWLAVFLFSCASPASYLILRDGGEPVELSLGPRQVANGVWFAFLAPDQAWSVTVTGSFNDWRPFEYQLTNLAGTPLWSGFVPLKAPDEIEFCYFVNAFQRLADPLAKPGRDSTGQAYSVFSLKADSPTNQGGPPG